MNRASLSTRRFVLVLCQLAMIVLFSGSALAAGRVEWKSSAVQERHDNEDKGFDKDGFWRLEVAIYMPKAPDVPHVPMKYEYQPVPYYARDLTDGD